MPSTPATYTVTTYLTTRLAQLGVRHLFSVPGDYNSQFLELVDEDGAIQRIGNCNELNAGYAADGYARANGLAAVAITNGVGACSIANAIAGSYVEMQPVILIVGTLSNQKELAEFASEELYHHNLPYGIDLNRSIYQDICVAFEHIGNPLTAPQQIDRALVACISKSQPVVLEIMEDCYSLECDAPAGTLSAIPPFASYETLAAMIANTGPKDPNNLYAGRIVGAINTAVAKTIEALQVAKHPVLWIGHEVHVYGLEAQVAQLLKQLNVPWVSSLLGKATLAENTPGFMGVYDGNFTSAAALAAVEDSDCFIGIGVWHADLSEFAPATMNPTPPLPSIWATRNVVKFNGRATQLQVSLQNFVHQLLAAIPTAHPPVVQPGPLPTPPLLPPVPADPTAPITYDLFGACLNSFLTPMHLVVADIGLSTFGTSAFLNINRQGGFLCQAIWAAIGWSVPATLGASFTSGTRPICIVGDGAFRLTCQEISTLAATNSNAVIFLLNNGVYGVEEILDRPSTYKNKTPFEQPNVLPPWDYVSLLKGFTNDSPTAMSAVVNTVGDLQSALVQIDANPSALWFVTINLNAYDYPAAWNVWLPSS